MSEETPLACPANQLFVHFEKSGNQTGSNFMADAVDDTREKSDDQPNVGKVAGRLGVDPSRASRMVAGAIRAHFVKRIASQLDGRNGAYPLRHCATMSRGAQQVTVTVVPYSGTGQRVVSRVS